MKGLTAADRYVGSAGDIVRQKLREFDEHLYFTIRQFDTGFVDPQEPATQSVQFQMSIESVKTALDGFEAAIAAVELPSAQRDDISADILTIKAQLAKKRPTLSVLQEAGKSLRNIVEGVAAGIMTPGIVAAASALWNALGLC